MPAVRSAHTGQPVPPPSKTTAAQTPRPSTSRPTFRLVPIPETSPVVLPAAPAKAAKTLILQHNPGWTPTSVLPPGLFAYNRPGRSARQSPTPPAVGNTPGTPSCLAGSLRPRFGSRWNSFGFAYALPRVTFRALSRLYPIHQASP